MKMFFFITLLFAQSLLSKEWPYPQDTPQTKPINIGTASDRPYDISRLILARGPYNASLNPQGTIVAYMSDVSGAPQLWLMHIKVKKVTQLTFGNGITNYLWHPNGKELIYGADNNGDEREAFNLISIDGLHEKIVLPFSDAYRVPGWFDASGRHFAYSSTERNGRDFDIYVVDFNAQSNKLTPRLMYQAEYFFRPHQWQPNGEHLIVTEAVGEDGANVYLLNNSNGKMSSVFKPQIPSNYDNFVWSGSGESFYFTSNEGQEMNALRQYDLSSATERILFSGDYDIESVQVCMQGKYLVWTTNESGFDKLHIYHLQRDNQQQIPLPQGVYSLSCAEQGKDLLVRITGPTTPGSVYLVDLTNQQTELLLAPNMAGVDNEEMLSPIAVGMPARDGVTIYGLLYLPRSKQNTLPPIIFNVHGGPTSQSRASWKPAIQYLLGKGVAVLDINVRGSTGFGKTYAQLDNQEKRLDSVRDLVDALAWLKKEGTVNVERSAVMGRSYGGYMVNAVMGAYPDAFSAGISIVGVADWVTALNTASPALKASDRIEYGDINKTRWQKFYAENSPINTVHKINAPMFYEHGVNDPRDPVAESDIMVKTLREKGLPVTYLRFPDEGHGISKVVNQVTFYQQLANFLQVHLID